MCPSVCSQIHTVLEVIKARWGRAGHLVYLVFCILTNLIVTGMLILGGSAVIEALTGKRWHARLPASAPQPALAMLTARHCKLCPLDLVICLAPARRCQRVRRCFPDPCRRVSVHCTRRSARYLPCLLVTRGDHLHRALHLYVYRVRHLSRAGLTICGVRPSTRPGDCVSDTAYCTQHACTSFHASMHVLTMTTCTGHMARFGMQGLMSLVSCLSCAHAVPPSPATRAAPCSPSSLSLVLSSV